jgi:hypothetical protein
VAYLELGLGSVSFNSTTYPGTCKPSDLPTLAIFKSLQAQLNRIVYAYNKITGNNAALISVDGDIGPGTMQQVEEVQALLTADTSMDVIAMASVIRSQSTDSCSAVANNAELLAAAAQAVADTVGAPASISQPSSCSSTLVSAMGKSTTVHTPTPANNGIATSLTDMVAGLDTTTLLLLAAGASAVIYYTGKKGRKTSKRRSSRRRRTSISIYR